MKRVAIILLILSFGIDNIKAQNCPLEWNKYKSDSYISDIQNDCNKNDMPETDFKNYLLNIARTNLAKQIQIKIQDIAKLEKDSNDGRTSINYSATTEFQTKVNLHLVKTITSYNSATKEGHAIAYIDKSEAYYYHRQQIETILMKAETVYDMARNYVESGFKSKAREELENILPSFKQTSESFEWLALLGQNEVSNQLLEKHNRLENTIKQFLAELQYGTKIYLVCTSEIFGQKNSDLQTKIKGVLADEGCSFVQSPEQADWTIEIISTSREYNKVNYGQVSTYFAYVDATISITKNITSQRIYEDQLSVKGGHTLNYKNAAQKAYNDLATRLGIKINEVIRQ